MKFHEDHTEMLHEPEHIQATQPEQEPTTGMSLNLKPPTKRKIDASTKPVQKKPRTEKKLLTEEKLVTETMDESS